MTLFVSWWWMLWGKGRERGEGKLKYALLSKASLRMLPTEMLFFPESCFWSWGRMKPADKRMEQPAKLVSLLIEEWKKKEKLPLNGRRPRGGHHRTTVFRVYKHKNGVNYNCRWELLLGPVALAELGSKEKKNSLLLRLNFPRCPGWGFLFTEKPWR